MEKMICGKCGEEIQPVNGTLTRFHLTLSRYHSATEDLNMVSGNETVSVDLCRKCKDGVKALLERMGKQK
jgi:hypothetical protein